MRIKTKLGLITLFFGFVFLSLAQVNTAFAVEPLKLQVPIPGGDETISFKKEGTTEPIGKYIQSLYTYAISIVGIVATIMLMFGGFTWLTAGGSGEKVGKARDIIFGSLTGLVLALTSYTILNLINPDLVNFKIQEIGSPTIKNKAPTVGEITGCCLVATKPGPIGFFNECEISTNNDCDTPLPHRFDQGNKCVPDSSRASDSGAQKCSTIIQQGSNLPTIDSNGNELPCTGICGY